MRLRFGGGGSGAKKPEKEKRITAASPSIMALSWVTTVSGRAYSFFAGVSTVLGRKEVVEKRLRKKKRGGWLVGG